MEKSALKYVRLVLDHGIDIELSVEKDPSNETSKVVRLSLAEGVFEFVAYPRELREIAELAAKMIQSK